MPPVALGGHLAAFLLAAWIGWSFGRNAAQVRWIALATLAALGAQLLALNSPERLANALPGPGWVWVADLTPQLAFLLMICALRAGAPEGEAGEVAEAEGGAEESPRSEPRTPELGGEVPFSRAAQVRRGVLGGALVGLALYASPLPWRARQGLLEGSWVDRSDPAYPVVRQSADASCAAAAAATLLRARGIAPVASEAQLAELCWTHPREGTSPLGLWRGLSLAAPKARVRYAWPSYEGLGGLAPCLIRVGLSSRVRDPELRRVLEEECGWAPGEGHAVVFYGYDQGRPGEEASVALIGDPRIGFERWGQTHFRALWHGVALELELSSND